MRHSVLILGASGMLGHKLAQRLARGFDVAATIRGQDAGGVLARRLGGIRIVPGVRAEDPGSVTRAVDTCEALFPHQLAEIAGARGARMFHFSTDCVFSGAAGNYAQDHPSDAADLYGRTKYLGEVDAAHCLTIRSSIIGHELGAPTGLIDWFLAQRGGTVNGFARAIYSGLTTLEMADLVARAITDWADLCGVWQVSSDPISKYDLLRMVNRVYGLGVRIERDEAFV